VGGVHGGPESGRVRVWACGGWKEGGRVLLLDREMLVILCGV